MNALASLIQEPDEGPARHALVWLHGLGATANDFAYLGRLLQCPGLRVIALQAPSRPVTLFGGKIAPAWFDILPQADGGVLSAMDELQESARRIRDELERQREDGIERLAVGGFSQGGALALFTALTHPEPLAAAVGLSCYLPQPEQMRKAGQLTWQTPMFMAHGSLDAIIPHEYGETTRDWLRENGVFVDWYGGAFEHTVPAEALDALGSFLRTRLG